MRNLLIFLLCFAANLAGAEEGIRALPVATIVALGKELYLRDQLAATAFDTLFEAYPKAEQQEIKGWITEIGKDEQRVYFIQEQKGRRSLAYVATFRKKEAPKVEDAKGAELPRVVASRFKARQAAIEAIPKFMTERYNFEVLDDPEGKGFLVYGLASTMDPNEMVVGGHYRVTVSAEGKVQRVDALSRSLLVLKKNSGPKGEKTVASVMTHIVSDTPVETHVFVNLLHKQPLYVTTSEKVIWKVEEGEITRVPDKP
jgi:hypothetical protein